MAEKTLSIKLSLNDKQFQSNLKKSMRSMKKFGNNMKSLGRTISTGLTLPILAFGLKIHPAIATTPTPISVVLPTITEGCIAFTNTKSGIVLTTC